MNKHSNYEPQSAFMKWLERRLPIASLACSSFIVYPTPRNLNYWWTFGGILAFMLGVQIVIYYFAFFFVILPLLGLFERTKPLPNSISESVLRHGVSVGASAPPRPDVQR